MLPQQPGLGGLRVSPAPTPRCVVPVPGLSALTEAQDRRRLLQAGRSLFGLHAGGQRGGCGWGGGIRTGTGVSHPPHPPPRPALPRWFGASRCLPVVFCAPELRLTNGNEITAVAASTLSAPPGPVGVKPDLTPGIPGAHTGAHTGGCGPGASPPPPSPKPRPVGTRQPDGSLRCRYRCRCLRSHP